MKMYRVPDLEFDVGLFVELDSFSEELDASCNLIIVGKDVADVLHEEGGLADAFVIEEIPEEPMSRILNTIGASFDIAIIIDKYLHNQLRKLIINSS
jgi:hypothetical protein